MTNEELQKLLIHQRELLELTQQDVAKLSGTGITRQYYGMIENGERKPSVNVAKQIANVLSVNWTIFFEVNCNQKLHKNESA